MTFPYKTLASINISNKTVLVRVDLNVPVHNGVVSDTTRIERVVSTLKYVMAQGAKLVILSHFDRPKGKVVPAMSLAPIRPALEKELGHAVQFVATDWQDTAAEQAVAAMKMGDVVLLENTRFHIGEEHNDPTLSQKMAALGDVFVMDAFSCAHRAHCSTAGIASFLPSVAGLACEAELKALNAALEEPTRPVLAIVGGAKVSSKIDLLANLVHKVDKLAIGGGMANTFLAARGVNVGKSLCEHELLETARNIELEAQKSGCELILPIDVVVARAFKANAACETVGLDAVPADAMILDIGAQSIAHINAVVAQCKTVVWNGPFGAFELTPFDAGTNAVAKAVAKATKAGTLQSIAGGGDTVSALNGAEVADDFTYISTAGGAFLEMLEGKALPGVEVLRG